VNALIWALAIFIAGVDQLTKFFVSRSLGLNETTEVIKGFFHLTLVHNTGAAFGIFKNQTIFFIVVSALAVIFIIAFMRKKSDVVLFRDIGFALILGGAFGNLVDRIRFGYVIDFLDFRIWPVFNVADSAVSAGVFLLILSLLCTRHSSK